MKAKASIRRGVNQMVIGIVGSRRRDSEEDLQSVSKAFFSIYKTGDTICSGGCPVGADRFAEIIAKKYDIPIMVIYPEWNIYGKRAGIIRNTEIAEKSNVLIACVAGDRTGGTENTIKKFLKLNSNNKLMIC